MGLQDVVNYALFNNPVCSGSIRYTKKLANYVGLTKPAETVVKKMNPPELYRLAAVTGPYIRIAGLSGAVAIILAAYGSHKKYADNEKGVEERRVFETASRYHLLHTISLLSLPLCKFPFLAGTLFLSGIILFCGPCYYSAFTGDKSYSKLTPVGGSCFILAWLTLCL